MLPLVITFGVWFTLYMHRTGIVLWYDISLWLAMSYAIVGPMCAGLAAWSSGRSRRRGMDDQLDSAPMPNWQQDLMTFVNAGAIGALAYGGVVLIVLGWAATQATWGRPYGIVILSGLVMVVLFSIVGAAIGMIWPHHLAALVALAILVGSVVLGASVQRGIGFSAGARELTLWNTLDALNHGGFSEWESRRVVPEITDVMVLASGVAALVIVGMLLARYRRMPFAVAAIATLAWTIAGAAMTTTGTLSPHVSMSDMPVPTASFSYVCSEARGIELCLHPSWTGLEAEIADIVTSYYGPVAGLDGVPTKLVQMDPRVQSRPAPDGATPLYLYEAGEHLSFQVTMGLHQQLFPSASPNPGGNGAQQVIGEWLSQEAGARVVFPFISTINTQGERVLIGPDPQDLYAALDRFAALSPDQQRAWLEANWDALRAGELTLEDLP